MAGKGSERLYWMHFEAGRGGAHVVPEPVLVESVTGIQRVVYLLAKFTWGEELGQRAAFSRALRETFALQCRIPEPASYALPFEIGSAAHLPPVPGEADEVRRLFRRVPFMNQDFPPGTAANRGRAAECWSAGVTKLFAKDSSFEHKNIPRCRTGFCKLSDIALLVRPSQTRCSAVRRSHRGSRSC